MPALGIGFGGNGDMPAYWALDQKGENFAQGTPCHGSFALRAPKTGKAQAGPNLTSYGLNGIDDVAMPSIIRNRLKRDIVLVSMGADKADGSLEWHKGKMQCRYIRQNSPILTEINNTLDEIAKRSQKPVYYHDKYLLTVHPLGGARMDENPQKGVVNTQGEVHDNAGLYIADAAALPSSPGTPPSMTISAWSRHVSMKILNQNANK